MTEVEVIRGKEEKPSFVTSVPTSSLPPETAEPPKRTRKKKEEGPVESGPLFTPPPPPSAVIATLTPVVITAPVPAPVAAPTNIWDTPPLALPVQPVATSQTPSPSTPAVATIHAPSVPVQPPATIQTNTTPVQPVATNQSIPSLATPALTPAPLVYEYHELCCDNEQCNADCLHITIPNIAGPVEAKYVCQQCGRSEKFQMDEPTVANLKLMGTLLGAPVTAAPAAMPPPPKPRAKKTAAPPAETKPAVPETKAAQPETRAVSTDTKSLVDGIVGYQPPQVDTELARVQMLDQVKEWPTERLIKKYMELTKKNTTLPTEQMIEVVVNMLLGFMGGTR